MRSGFRCWRDSGSPANATAGAHGNKELVAMPGLDRGCQDRAAPRNALIWRKVGPVLDTLGQQLKGTLRMRLDQYELRERRHGVLIGLDVIAVLHLVEAVGRALALPVVPLVATSREGGGDGARIGSGLEVDRQRGV